MSSIKQSQTPSHYIESSKVQVRRKPFDIARATAMLGSEEAALALFETLKDPHCSKEGLSVILEVMHGVAGGQKLDPHRYENGQINKYSFSTSTTIKNEYFDNSEFSLHLIFSPELKVQKECLMDDMKGFYCVDLSITLRVIGNAPVEFGGGLIFEVPVFVEFDGHLHLSDEQVRRDKTRDSMLQSKGVHIFRIQSPYRINKDTYEQELTKLIQFHVTNIKCLLWNQLNSFITITTNFNEKCNQMLKRRAEQTPVTRLKLFK